MTGRLTVRSTGEVISEIVGAPLIEPKKEQWMQSTLMTICSKPPKPDVPYSGWSSSLTLSSDGQSATLIATTAGNGSVNRGILYKRAAETAQRVERVEN